jgi:DNA-3-methyladenine glycosylase I
MLAYHDTEWGVPSRSEHHLFEMLVLEGAQAGLSWSTILAKRENYRQALDGFDPERIARYEEPKHAELLADVGIVRNRLKVRSLAVNARAFVATAAEHGSFARYLWSWVDDLPVVHRPRLPEEVPARTDLSDALSRDLKRRGFTFVGTTIVYAFLEAVGVVDDHLVGCPCKQPSAGR